MRHRALHVTILLALGCSDSGTTPVVEERVPASIVLNESEVVIDDGGAVQLRAELRDQKGERFETLPPGVTLRWSSSDSMVASVIDGLVSAQRPGSAEVAVQAGELRAGATIRVRAVPRAMEYTGGSGQRATVGAVLPDSLSVRVLDRHGNGVPGVPVDFTVTAGAGPISPETTSTNADGFARAAWTLGTAAGENRAEARAAGIEAPPVVFVATGTSGPAAALHKVSGDDQTGRVGSPLPGTLVVRIADAFGNPVGGVAVLWDVTAGGGSPNPPRSTTDATGLAATSWTLGAAAGENRATATVDGLNFLPFTATGTPSAPARLVVVRGTGQSGTVADVLPEALVVRVVDPHGNPVAGGTVTWSITGGGGSVSPAVARSDADGFARAAWTLGTAAGGNAAAATLSGVSPATFEAMGTPGTAATLTMIGGDGQSGIGGEVLPAPLVVQVRDRYGNEVPEVEIRWSGNGSFSPATGKSGADGRAQTRWMLGDSAGTQSAEARVSGTPGAAFTATATRAPTASTAPATSITTTSAVLNGTVNPQGPPAVAWFEWGTSNTLVASASTPSRSVGSGQADTLVSAELSGLSPGTTYYYRTAASNGSGTGRGSITRLTTAAEPTATSIRVITFGDSNTDYGFRGRESQPRVASYVSWRNTLRLAPSAPNSPLQLAGKIEAGWAEIRTKPLSVVNHGVGWTATGSGRSPRSSPDARTVVDDVTRFEAEVLGEGYPWSGGETSATYFPEGPIRRVNAFTPGPDDFVYISLGTNDPSAGLSTSETIANLEWMVDQWVAAGLPAEHLIVTTLAPRGGTSGQSFPQINDGIRAMASRREIHLIDLATYTSDDNGLTWRSGSLHVGGDSTHYAESVRDWLAERVVEYVARNAP